VRRAQGPRPVLRGAGDLHDRAAGGRQRAHLPRFHRPPLRAETVRIHRLRPGAAGATRVLSRAPPQSLDALQAEPAPPLDPPPPALIFTPLVLFVHPEKAVLAR